jgi:DNA-binding MarR family transcriptional regulator
MLTAKVIGARTYMHKTKVSRAVAQLERRKLVVRRANRDDLREAFLSLTAAGRDVLGGIVPLAIEFADRLMETVDAADRPALDRALRTLGERSAKLAGDIAKRLDAG